MKKFKFKFVFIYVILILVIIFSYIYFQNNQDNNPMSIKQNLKKVLLIIADKGFQDIEYQDTRAALEQGNVDVFVASLNGGQATGKFGTELEVDGKIEDINNIDEFKAIIFIGGPGSVDYVDNLLVNNLINQANNKQKIIGAICIAPTILAKAGILKGKQATVWSDELNKDAIEILEQAEAEYIDEPMVIHGNIITANGPAVAFDFGKKIIENLK